MRAGAGSFSSLKALLDSRQSCHIALRYASSSESLSLCSGATGSGVDASAREPAKKVRVASPSLAGSLTVGFGFWGAGLGGVGEALEGVQPSIRKRQATKESGFFIRG